jgi:hypothetical protein
MARSGSSEKQAVFQGHRAEAETREENADVWLNDPRLSLSRRKRSQQ